MLLDYMSLVTEINVLVIPVAIRVINFANIDIEIFVRSVFAHFNPHVTVEIDRLNDRGSTFH